MSIHLLKFCTIVLLFAFTGCGTVINSNPQRVRITSDPNGAAVDVNGENRGVTPLELLLKVDQDYSISVEAQGYPPETRILQRSLSIGAIVGDVFLMVVPIIIDIYMDRLYYLDPEGDLHFQFAEVAAPPPPPVQMQLPTPPPANVGEQQESSDSNQYCCVNGAFYACPDLSAVAQCAPPELGGCMMSCGAMDMNCPEQCMAKYPVDPSSCSRTPARDGECK